MLSRHRVAVAAGGCEPADEGVGPDCDGEALLRPQRDAADEERVQRVQQRRKVRVRPAPGQVRGRGRGGVRIRVRVRVRVRPAPAEQQLPLLVIVRGKG